MGKIISRILIPASLAILGYFCLSLFATISQVANFSELAYPGSAKWVFWCMVVVFSGLLLTPLYIYFRLPKPPVPPSDGAPKAVAAFQNDLRERLQGNPLLSGMALETNDEIPAALSKLGSEAGIVIKNTASTVFVSTAVMQNGRLDGLFVLAGQLRMVWRIASIYYQRPSPRQMLYLYSNVGANVLIAESIQEIDFSEIATPVVAAIFPSLKGGIPGLQGVASLLVNSLANGAANAFLTLRVGLIAKTYCEALSLPSQNSVRKSTTSEALVLVAGIVKDQGGQIVEKSWRMVRDTITQATGTTIQGAKNVLSKTASTSVDGVKTVGEKIGSGWQSIKERIPGKEKQ